MRQIIQNIVALAAMASSFQAFASPQTFSVVPAQPVAGESFQLVVPVDGCGLSSVTGALQPGSFVIDVDIEYLPDVFCIAVATEPQLVNVKIFRENNVAQEGVYRVSLSHSIFGSDAPARPSGFGLISVQKKDARSPAAADSGAWMEDPGFVRVEEGLTLGELNSQRVHIEQRGARIVLNFNTFDLKGNAVWLRGEGVRQGNVFNANLVQVVGRSPFDTTLVKKPEYTLDAGQVSIEFLSPARAVLWLSQSGSLENPFATVPLKIVKQNSVGEARKAFEGRWVLTLEETDDSVSAMPSRIFDLKTFQNNGLESYVDSQTNMFALVCSGNSNSIQELLSNGSQVALAPSCDLIRFGQFVDAQFNEIGWNRLRGVNSAGKRVSLLRISD